MSGRMIYIAGPMRGIPYYNFPAFDAAAMLIRARGDHPVNPADLDRAAGFDAMTLAADANWHDIPATFDFMACVRRDIDALLEADGLALLQGWEGSSGARAERAVADWIGIPVEVLPTAAQVEALAVAMAERRSDD